MGYSDSGTIIIDNPVLLEILVRYCEMGAFGDFPYSFYFGDDKSEYPGFSKTTAFFEDEFDNEIISLSELTTELLWFLSNQTEDDYDGEMLEQLYEECSQRTEEIDRSYQRVLCTYGLYSNEVADEYGLDVKGYLDIEKVFTYDPENGENCYEIVKDADTGEVLKTEGKKVFDITSSNPDFEVNKAIERVLRSIF